MTDQYVKSSYYNLEKKTVQQNIILEKNSFGKTQVDFGESKTGDQF